MKNIKIIGIISLVLMVCTFGAYSQEQRGKDRIENANERFEKQTERLTKSLDLTADQITKLKDINNKTIKELKELREAAIKDKNDKNEKKDDVKKIMDSRISQIQDILTPEQKTKFQAFVEKMKDRKVNRDK